MKVDIPNIEYPLNEGLVLLQDKRSGGVSHQQLKDGSAPGHGVLAQLEAGQVFEGEVELDEGAVLLLGLDLVALAHGLQAADDGQVDLVGLGDLGQQGQHLLGQVRVERHVLDLLELVLVVLVLGEHVGVGQRAVLVLLEVLLLDRSDGLLEPVDEEFEVLVQVQVGYDVRLLEVHRQGQPGQVHLQDEHQLALLPDLREPVAL
jgi:hypothetical protein